MDKEVVKDNIDIFLKWLDGAEIQIRPVKFKQDYDWNTPDFYDRTEVTWVDVFEYRIKPREPREFRIYELADGSISRLPMGDSVTSFKVIEAIEE